MIKYLGSKRRLVPVLGELFSRSGARTALDLFTGTTRVAQELKRRGALVTALDSARYADVFARCYVATDARAIDRAELEDAVAALDGLPGAPGYFTETFCERSRYLRPENGARVDAIRDALDDRYRDSPLFPVLLTSLVEAADRVDSTVGVQMAYLKQWAPRALQPLRLRAPELLAGSGRAVRADAVSAVGGLGRFDFAYLDPPYNQHRYFTNYHVWETLVAWDAPDHYGVACKRADARLAHTKSAFNGKRTMPDALRTCIEQVDTRLLVLSYNDESWMSLDALVDACAVRGEVACLGFDSARYVGARIGIHDQAGRKVGTVSHLRNVEYVLVCGARDLVARVTAPFAACDLAGALRSDSSP
jgi:adenine-specific DNA-methyltransferase